MDAVIEKYKAVAGELEGLESRAEALKLERGALAKQLFERDGKGHVYDLGDGKPMIIVSSKNKTYFFSPKDKWSGRPKGSKKAIVNGEIVEVPTVSPRRIEASAVLTSKGELATADLPRVSVHHSVNEPGDEDPLAAALAAIR